MSAPFGVDEGDASAPPRANGEIVFQHPWQRRSFATTMALFDAGVVDREDFRQHLIAEIARRDREGDVGASAYWDAWHDALELLVAELRICAPEEITERARRFDRHPPHGGSITIDG